MSIPFVDLKAQYKRIKEEIGPALDDVMANTAFIGGERLSRFEQNFAKYAEADHAVGASSGTSALHLALADRAREMQAGPMVRRARDLYFRFAEESPA